MKKIYLDNQSNTILDDHIFEKMLPYFKENYGNPQSIYSLGQISKDAVEQARNSVAKLINAKNNEIIFTSCGSEANNLAIKGFAFAHSKINKHIIVSAIEHFSILNAVNSLKQHGFEITTVPVDKQGFVKIEALKQAMKDETILVSIQHANPEIGVIQNLSEIAKIVKNKNVALHVDAVASAGMIPIDVEALNIDMLTLSSSVMYGPKGAAAIYIRKGTPVKTQIDGGVQEFSKRAGTENVPAIAGFGAACDLAAAEMRQNAAKMQILRDKLINGLKEKIKFIYLNGPVENRLPNNVNFSIEFVEGEALFLLLDAKGIMAASGSSCASKSLKMSHVLTALEVDTAVGQGSIVFTLSKYNTVEEIDYVINEFPAIVERLRQMSPLYDHFMKTGERMKAGPGTDYGHEHEHCEN
ncbi:MAG: cysteine desulfurase family protein [Endomicrobiaceae bacterium]|jgi:cysteine desulfurase|nr:cysteine desulfurase family protein [Endomicrobiaceae bacterium]MDD3730612.1 cysteine desulfurase family protein [Endomicrobiaceae bacterium]MDD4165619.1 cysteine desulfurase family protein [Endomicrobiaceae bacterium]